MLLTSSLLERLRNNMLVVEVWDKQTTADGDRLLGIVKLPLHQFYMSFRDSKIANSLLKSQVRPQGRQLPPQVTGETARSPTRCSSRR